MRTIVILLFILSCLTGNSQVSADTISISGFQIFKRIPTCFGENCQSGEACSPLSTETRSSGYMVYEDVRIGKIRHCRMLCETSKGTCQKSLILVKDAEGVKQAGKQAGKQFGEPIYSKEGDLYVYTWKYSPPKEKQLNVRLEVATDLQHAKLFIE